MGQKPMAPGLDGVVFLASSWFCLGWLFFFFSMGLEKVPFGTSFYFSWFLKQILVMVDWFNPGVPYFHSGSSFDFWSLPGLWMFAKFPLLLSYL